MILVPALYLLFDFYRKRLGVPPKAQDQRLESLITANPIANLSDRDGVSFYPKTILVPYNGSLSADFALKSGVDIGEKFGAKVTTVYVEEAADKQDSKLSASIKSSVAQFEIVEDSIEYLHIKSSDPKGEVVTICETREFDLICFASGNLKEKETLFSDSMEYSVLYSTTPPVLFYRPSPNPISRVSRFKNILIPLDGSEVAEQVLPYAASFALHYGATIHLLCVPETQGDSELNRNLLAYLEHIKNRFFSFQPKINLHVTGSGPLRTIIDFAESSDIDLIAIASHGRDGLGRQNFVKIGSVSSGVLTGCDIPTLFISAKTE